MIYFFRLAMNRRFRRFIMHHLSNCGFSLPDFLKFQIMFVAYTVYLYKTDVQGSSSASVSKVQIVSVFCAYIIDQFFRFFFFQKLYFKDMKISIADKSNWNKLNWRIWRSIFESTSYFYEGFLFSKTQTAIPCYLPVFSQINNRIKLFN